MVEMLFCVDSKVLVLEPWNSTQRGLVSSFATEKHAHSSTELLLGNNYCQQVQSITTVNFKHKLMIENAAESTRFVSEQTAVGVATFGSFVCQATVGDYHISGRAYIRSRLFGENSDFI